MGTCLLVGYLRPLLRFGIEGVSHGPLLGELHTPPHKLPVDLLFHKHSGGRGAALALVEEHTLVSLLHSVVHYKRKHPCPQQSLACGLPREPPSSPLQRPRCDALPILAYASE